MGGGLAAHVSMRGVGGVAASAAPGPNHSTILTYGALPRHHTRVTNVTNLTDVTAHLLGHTRRSLPMKQRSDRPRHLRCPTAVHRTIDLHSSEQLRDVALLQRSQVEQRGPTTTRAAESRGATEATRGDACSKCSRKGGAYGVGHAGPRRKSRDGCCDGRGVRFRLWGVACGEGAWRRVCR